MNSNAFNKAASDSVILLSLSYLSCSYFVSYTFYLCQIAFKKKRWHYRHAIFVHISTLVKGNEESDPVCALGNSLKSPLVSEYAVLHDHTSPYLAKLNYSLLYLCWQSSGMFYSGKVMAGVIKNALWEAKMFSLPGN